eukprot:COSAG02_NODE_19851_length_861_cov_3.981250_1_plen_243_part_10
MKQNCKRWPRSLVVVRVLPSSHLLPAYGSSSRPLSFVWGCLLPVCYLLPATCYLLLAVVLFECVTITDQALRCSSACLLVFAAGVRGLFSVAVVADAPPVTPAPIVAAVGSWTTPKKTGSMPTAEALASARSGRWERLERLEAREAERCLVHFYVAREPDLVQSYGACGVQANDELVNYYSEVPAIVTYYRARASPAEVNKQAAARRESAMLRDARGGSYVPPSRRSDGPSRLARADSTRDRG